MRKFLYENGLTLTMFGLFSIFWIGQIATGLKDFNSERVEHGAAEVSLGKYFRSCHFFEATSENWESEFLQMGLLVLFSVFLRQRGAPDSKKLAGQGTNEVDADPVVSPSAPWPVRRGGWTLRLYENSLTLVLLSIFLISFSVHAVSSNCYHNEVGAYHGEAPLTLAQHLTGAAFWFESFQNWQSEFLSVGALFLFSIYLRQKGSPQSKRVDASSDQTGN